MSKLSSVSTHGLKALEKAIATELKDRGQLEPGSYNVDMDLSLQVQATVTKCADEEYTPTIKIAHKAAMALLVRHCGITGKAAVHALEMAMREAMEANEQSESYISALADLEVAEKKIQESLANLPKAKRTGKTFVKNVKVE